VSEVERSQEMFDGAAGLEWRLTVYDAVHDGWRFTNIAGRRALEDLGERVGASPHVEVLELCCGLGDTCRYLAERFGWRVTGLERNAHQLAAARAQLARARAHVAERVRFEAVDVTAWTPERRYHAVLILDSLMYLRARSEMLVRARRSLRPGAPLWLGEVLAGPGFDRALAAELAASEGVVSLPTPDAQLQMLAAARFDAIDSEDWSALAVDCFGGIVAATRAHEATLVSALGARRYDRWLADNERQRQLFAGGALVYHRTIARAPAEE
jgi:SAM-dependent methyltransferase